MKRGAIEEIAGKIALRFDVHFRFTNPAASDLFNAIVEALRNERKACAKATGSLIEAVEYSLTTPGMIRGRDQLKNALEVAAAIRKGE